VKNLAHLVFALLAVVLTLSGCTSATGVSPEHSQQATDPTPTAPAGANNSIEATRTAYEEPRPAAEDWTLYTLEDDNIALSIPPGWMKFDLSEDNLDAILGETMDANPEFGGSMSDQIRTMTAKGIKFYAFDLHSPELTTGYPANVNLIRTARPKGLKLDDLMEQMESLLEKQLGVKLDSPLQSERMTTLGGQKLGRIQYSTSFNMPNGSSVSFTMVQYLAFTDSDYYVLSAGASLSSFEDYEDTFDIMAKGMYFLKPVN
jgi:hypothetical protein